MSSEKCDALIVGGGPAGLRCAELLSAAGFRTVLADHKASVGRKFLVAGRGGLNLTHSEPVENFAARYGEMTERWRKMLGDFSPHNLRTWAMELDIETFIGTSGRVFPVQKQAAPLLRRWIERLRKQGVSFRPRHSLTRFRQMESNEWEVEFTMPKGAVILHTRVLMLAMGGASWPETGSDGGWVSLLTKAGVCVAPLTPANCGYEVGWSPEFLAKTEGLPLKNVVVRAGDDSTAGELLITKYGIEGGALYQLGRTLRALTSPQIEIDLKPAFTVEQLSAKIRHAQGQHLLDQARRAWRLSRVAVALLELLAPFNTAGELAVLTKTYPLKLAGPRPIEEAISSAGGVSWDELDDDLMLKRCPGIYCAGEMIDWDASTGGYLIQGCFSTATRAARGAERFLVGKIDRKT